MDSSDEGLGLSGFPLWGSLAPRQLPTSGNTFEEFNEAWPSLGDDWCFQTHFPEFANGSWMNKGNTVINSWRDTIFNEGKIENGGSLSLDLCDQKEDGELKLTGVRDKIRRTVEQCVSESPFSSVNTPEGRESSSPRKRRKVNSQELSMDSPLSCTTPYTEFSATSLSVATPTFSPLDESPFYFSSQGDGSEVDLQTGFGSSMPINLDIIDVDAELGQWGWDRQSQPQQSGKTPDSDGLTPLEMPDGTIRFTTNWLPASTEDYSTDVASNTDMQPPVNAS
ncbi:predicted protein [Paecilomyces variotii No. 5]|uniref:Uncharacterized protein n=1 Tax=Byssochlamys spectabilis (strain No. 5 / NBRC 109023) TaxID=1356009 RepID=V5FMA2_BYSSN|nr:predicted protein [Paecilomyces variotii No. 5]